MKIANIIARTLLGLIFVVFGLNAFFNFIPLPPPKGELAGEFMKALLVSHYFYAVKCFEISGGLLLLSGRYTALGLMLVGPVIVNILGSSWNRVGDFKHIRAQRLASQHREHAGEDLDLKNEGRGEPLMRLKVLLSNEHPAEKIRKLVFITEGKWEEGILMPRCPGVCVVPPQSPRQVSR